jgi:hypothetical protein
MDAVSVRVHSIVLDTRFDLIDFVLSHPFRDLFLEKLREGWDA